MMRKEQNKKFGRQNEKEEVLINLILLSLVPLLMVYQRSFGGLRIIGKEEMTGITIAIYSLYGLFASFIQFLISYSAGKENDIYWGYSKVKHVWGNSLAFRIFKSFGFKVLLGGLSFFIIFDFEKISESLKIHLQVEMVFSTMVSILIFMFVLLFFNGLHISNTLFRVQENADASEDETEESIREKVLKQYRNKFESVLVDQENEKELFEQILSEDFDNIFKKLGSKKDVVYVFKEIKECCVENIDALSRENKQIERVSDLYLRFIVEIFERNEESMHGIRSEDLAQIINLKGAFLKGRIKDDAEGIQGEFTKNIVLKLLLTRIYKEENLNLIKNTLEVLGTKYIELYICCIMLGNYVGPTGKKWKQDIDFLRSLIIWRCYVEDNLLGEKNIDYIAKTIAAQNKGLDESFVKTSLDNLKKSEIDKTILENLEGCKTFNFIEFIKLKYIFNIGRRFSGGFLEKDILDDKARTQFIREISNIPQIATNRYIKKIIHDLFGKPNKKIDIDIFIQDSSFEMFVLIVEYIDIELILRTSKSAYEP